MSTDAGLPETSTVTTLAGELEELGQSLRSIADAVDQAAERIAPHTDDVCDRYRSAVATWPAAPAPSYERLAGLLATIHEAGAAVRIAAGRCEGADHAVRVALGQERRT